MGNLVGSTQKIDTRRVRAIYRLIRLAFRRADRGGQNLLDANPSQ